MFISGRQGLFNQNRWLISRFQWLLDGTVVVALLVVICWFYTVPLTHDYFILGAVTFLLTIMVFQGSRLYRPWRGVFLGQLVRQVFLAWVLVAAILAVLGYLTKTSDIFSRRVLLTWFVHRATISGCLTPASIPGSALAAGKRLQQPVLRLSPGPGTLVGGWEKMLSIQPG